MHCISFGAEGDNSMEVVSVKILLKQAYSAHVAKVKSLESELRELKEKCFQINKIDKTECTQCKEMQKTLDACKQEHAAALQDQEKKVEFLAQKLTLLENRSQSSTVENPSAKQDATKKSPKLQSESSRRKQVLKNINTNTGLPNENCLDKKSNQNKVANAHPKVACPVEADTSLSEAAGPILCTTGILKSKTTIPPVNKKDVFSSLQDSFLDDYNGDSSVVLVPETLDMLDEVLNKTSDKKNLGVKDISTLSAKSTRIPLDADEGKENIFGGTKSSSSERSSGKRCSASSSNEVEQTIKKCKSINSKETRTSTDKIVTDANLPITNSSVVKARDTNICSKKDDPSNVSDLENLNSFSVNPSFFEVDPSFEMQSVLNNKKKSKTHALEVSHDDDADFQTSVVSKIRGNDKSGPWKTAKKNTKKSDSIKNVKTTSRFKMSLESPSLNFKKPKYKQTKLSKSVFQSSHTSATDDVHPSEVVNFSAAEDKDSNGKANLKEEKGNCNGTQKDLDAPNETLTWGGGTLTFSEMENLRNMTIDMDVTFVPDLLLQNSNDSAPDVPGSSNVTECPLGPKADLVKVCNKEEINSPDIVDDANREGMLCEERPKSCANQQRVAYYVEQYPEKKASKPPVPKNGKQKYNSFDRVPSPEMPSYKFKEDPVRNKDKRQQLKGFECKECEKYYSTLGLSDQEKRKRLKQCSRHRATYVPPSTPEHFWELEFPDTQECKERGYLGETQKVSLKSRRRRPLK